MFVTAVLMDPSGQPVIKAEEDAANDFEPSAAGMVDESIISDISSNPPAQ